MEIEAKTKIESLEDVEHRVEEKHGRPFVELQGGHIILKRRVFYDGIDVDPETNKPFFKALLIYYTQVPNSTNDKDYDQLSTHYRKDFNTNTWIAIETPAKGQEYSYGVGTQEYIGFQLLLEDHIKTTKNKLTK